MVRPDVREARIIRKSPAGREETDDLLAVEEPLEIRLRYGPENARQEKKISITMRTPGADEDLAIGFLFTEGIVSHAKEIIGVKHLEKVPGILADENVIIVELSPQTTFDLKKLERNFYTTSSCGVCGKASIDAIKTVTHKSDSQPLWKVSATLLYHLPDLLRQAQENFQSTGGLHASAIFDLHGELLTIREDVGRHNALDKLIGYFFRHNVTHHEEHILLLSGRASFELLQKAAMAGIKLVCAVGAPSSLAVETAAEFGITLVGFLKRDKLNIYSGGERVIQ